MHKIISLAFTLSEHVEQNLSWISIVSPFQQVLLNNLFDCSGTFRDVVSHCIFKSLWHCTLGLFVWYSTMRVDACGQPVSPSSHTEVFSWWQTDLFSNVAMQILFFAHFVIFVNKLSRGKCFFLSVLLY